VVKSRLVPLALLMAGLRFPAVEAPKLPVVRDIRFDCGHCGASHDLEEFGRGLYYGRRSLRDYRALAEGRRQGLPVRIARWRVNRAILRAIWGDR
jgi:hypothetical protein